MMQFSKSASSPVRLPHLPLMTFIRSTTRNTRSRSRSSTRSSPISLKNNHSSALDSQEPSSPKVTCIGQIRVRRSKVHRPRCTWIRTASCYPRSLSLCICCSSGNGGDVAPPAAEQNLHRIESERIVPKSVDEKDSSDDLHVSIECSSPPPPSPPPLSPPPPPSPPRNVMLLMKCRSAPYKSSSLLCRFWSSPPSEIRTLTATIPEVEEEACVQSEKPAAIILTRCRSAPSSTTR